MSTKDFLNIGLETTRGSALHGLKDEGAAGAFDFAVLDFSGVLVDTEVFGLGRDLYEFNLIATDNTLDTGTGDEYNNTAPGPIQVPLTEAQVAAGDVILIDSEFMKVTDTGPNSSTVVRGYAGSTIAVHTDSVTILEAVQQIAATSNFPVPITSTTAATAKPQVAAAVNYFTLGANERLGGGTAKVDQAGLLVEAIVGGGTDAVTFAMAADRTSAASSDGTEVGIIVDFVVQAGQDDLIQRVDGGSWLDEGVRVGQVITIANAADGGNNVAHTVNAVGDTDLSTSVSVTGAVADTVDFTSDVGLTNGTLTLFGNGVEPVSQQYSKVVVVATGTGALEFYAPFDVAEAWVTLYGADGAIIEAAANTVSVDASRLVTVSAAGSLAAGVIAVVQFVA